jgi:hypothetical protein
MRSTWLVCSCLALALAACGDESAQSREDGGDRDAAPDLADANMVCPGHIDPGPPSRATISTADGSATIAEVRLPAGEWQSWLRVTGVEGVGDSSDGSRVFRLPAPAATVEVGFELWGRNVGWDAGHASGSYTIGLRSADGRAAETTFTIYVQLFGTHCDLNQDCCPSGSISSVETYTLGPRSVQIVFPGGLDASATDAGPVDGGHDVAEQG